jgi:hypothetical protein
VFENDPSTSIVAKVNETYFQYRELFINKIVNEPFEDIPTPETINKDSSLFVNKIPEKEGFWENYNYTGITKLLE